MQKDYYLLYFRKSQEEINYYDYPPPGELEQQVFGIFRTTRNVLRASDKRLGHGIDGEDGLRGAVGALEDIEALADLAKGVPVQALGENAVKLIEAKNTWAVGAATLQLIQLARPLYIAAQNKAIEELLGEEPVTITRLPGAQRDAIQNLPEAGFHRVDGPITGIVTSVRTDIGHIGLAPLDNPVSSNDDWNVAVLDREGSPQISMSLEPVQVV